LRRFETLENDVASGESFEAISQLEGAGSDVPCAHRGRSFVRPQSGLELATLEMRIAEEVESSGSMVAVRAGKALRDPHHAPGEIERPHVRGAAVSQPGRENQLKNRESIE
jgi:hypothetical protein